MTCWTDERIELLEKLWIAGQSAAQIAGQLGGVSRNSVIGKIHRMGLAGRAAPAKPRAPSVKSSPWAGNGAHSKGASGGKVAVNFAFPGAKLSSEPKAPFHGVMFAVEPPGAATMLTLGPHMCRWPIGDPALPNFTLCGHRADEGSYCPQHRKVAYQPASVKARVDGRLGIDPPPRRRRAS